MEVWSRSVSTDLKATGFPQGASLLCQDDKKADLEQRIKENQQKIEELSAFFDDPQITKSFELSRNR